MDLKSLIEKLTLEEKLQLLTGKNNWETVAVERLGIPSIFVSDGPHGLRKMVVDENGNYQTLKSTCFPTASAMAATWNPELAYEVGECIAEECQAENVDIILGPGVNIKRTPLCGRNFEYFSEDPYLAGEMAAAYINGVQSRNVGTSLKHYAANNQEYDRHHISSEVDIRALREIYLKPFEIAVKKAQPWTVMCSYNRINGVYGSEHKWLLDDVLRKEWGFEGFVVSDWGAVWDRAKSLKASLELAMPYNENHFNVLKKAYEEGKITDDEINSALERLLKIVFRAYEARKNRIGKYDAEKHHEVAKKVALESITLLKNDNNILPINREKVKKLAIIGEFAAMPVIQGGGSAHVQTAKVDAPLDRIKELAQKEGIEVEYAISMSVPSNSQYNQNSALRIAENADQVIIFAGNRGRVESEGYDRTSIKLSPDIENAILQISRLNPNTVVVVQAGSAIDMTAWIGRVKAVVFDWYSGQAGGSAIAEILFGVHSPSGKIAETFPICLEDTPAYGTYPGNGIVSWYREGIMVGYRYYDTFEKPVLFPFGHGLSYTQFEYSDLKITPDVAGENDEITVSFSVKNTGNMHGKETVQLYVRDMCSHVLRPFKELKGFAKVDLKPGEKKEVTFRLGRDAFAYYSIAENNWHVEGGEYKILIGASSQDIRLTGRVKINKD